MFDINKIFEIQSAADFSAVAIELFSFQSEKCEPYKDYLNFLEINPKTVTKVEDIPFMPIEFFKSHKVYISDSEPEAVFTSSGTTGSVPSCHYVSSLALYEESFRRGFELFYGAPQDVTIFALLPSYLERRGSSLIYMADKLMKMGHGGGFFLDDYDKMLSDMDVAATKGSKILLLGVSFALWELAETHQINYPNMVVMETGGMKGRREEIPREELHNILCNSFGVKSIHSEYGMTELLSQGYSLGDGIFKTPSWMQIMIRDLHDPLEYIKLGQSGGVNVIDLANVYSCAFIETQDMGVKYADGSFRIVGRIDKSEIRGCNLMVAK